jgi:hypothetical protein
MKVVAIKKF